MSVAKHSVCQLQLLYLDAGPVIERLVSARGFNRRPQRLVVARP
jgi:hypothetical protein